MHTIVPINSPSLYWFTFFCFANDVSTFSRWHNYWHLERNRVQSRLDEVAMFPKQTLQYLSWKSDDKCFFQPSQVCVIILYINIIILYVDAINKLFFAINYFFVLYIFFISVLNFYLDYVFYHFSSIWWNLH